MKRNNKPNRIVDLENKIKRLTKELESTEQLNEVLSENYLTSEKERKSYRDLLKYHTLVMLILNLIYEYTDETDIGIALRKSINIFYKELSTNLLINIPVDEDGYDDIDEEYDDEEEFADASID